MRYIVHVQNSNVQLRYRADYYYRARNMLAKYSVDLRWRAVWLHLIWKMSYAEIADVLFMSQQSVQRYVDLYQSTGDVEPKKQRHGPQQMLSDFEKIVVLQSMIDI